MDGQTQYASLVDPADWDEWAAWIAWEQLYALGLDAEPIVSQN